jgi:hypothetical protein
VRPLGGAQVTFFVAGTQLRDPTVILNSTQNQDVRVLIVDPRVRQSIETRLRILQDLSQPQARLPFGSRRFVALKESNDETQAGENCMDEIFICETFICEQTVRRLAIGFRVYFHSDFFDDSEGAAN